MIKGGVAMPDTGVSNLNASTAGQIRIGHFYINRIGFGAMRITGNGIWGEPDDRGAMIELLKAAVDLGVNFIDTADAYGPEVSENLIKEALFPYTGIVIATKGGMVRGGPGMWSQDCSPSHLRQACEASLKRLNVDTIDLYQLHTVDSRVPFEESFQTMLDLQKEGKIKDIGLSNIEPENFETALNMGSFVSVQNNYNVFNREHEDVLRLCEEHSIAFIPYFPVGGNIAGGLGNELLSQVAQKYQATNHQIALSWLLNHSDNIVPIPGTSSIEHLKQNIAIGDVKLDNEDIEILDGLSGNIS